MTNTIRDVFLLLIIISLTSTISFPQRLISGSVHDEENSPVAGVNVQIKNTTSGTISDVNGKFQIDVTGNDTKLIFSYIGFESQEILVGNQSIIDITLISNPLELNEIVVTALNISRDQKTLGYSIQEIDGDEVSQGMEPNVVNALSGRIAGVYVKQSNAMGGSANINIRGISSLYNNQPLFVVDGVPVNNETLRAFAQDQNYGGYDYGNLAQDINPEDIDKITVLKGASSAALYGSRAANGVILITTKDGTRNKGIGFNWNSSVIFSQVNKATLPKYQREYGAGYGRYYEDPTGYFYYGDVNGDGNNQMIVPTSEDASWGGKFDENQMVVHWDALDPLASNYGEERPYVAPENSLIDFFETGLTFNNNLSFSGGNDKTMFRLSYTNEHTNGILPNSKLKRNFLSVKVSHQLTDKFIVYTGLNYTNINTKGRFGTGYDPRNVFQSFGGWFQANLDFNRLRNYRMTDGSHNTWNKIYWTDPTPLYFNNPYWERYENYQTDRRNRLFGHVKLEYSFTDWLRVHYQASGDFWGDLQEERYSIGSVSNIFFDPEFEIAPADYTKRTRSYNEINHEFIATLQHSFNQNLKISGLIGGNLRKSRQDLTSISSRDGLVVEDLYSIFNSVSNEIQKGDQLIQLEQQSIFAQINFELWEQLFFDFTGRNDWSSTLPEENNSYFYPSASVNWVFSELGGISRDRWFSYGSLRVNWAQVGNDALPYITNNYYFVNPNYGDQPSYSVEGTLNNENLKPETQQSVEIGLDARFFNNRLGFDFAVYKNNTFDQIIQVSTSSASGYFGKFINAGNIENKGIEITLNSIPVRYRQFEWNLILNWTKNKNTVLELSDDIDNIWLSGGFITTLNASEGEPYGTIKGTNYVYHENGLPIVDSNGLYLATESTQEVLGTYQPNWNMGIINNFTLGNWTLTSLIDIQNGGSLSSEGVATGQSTGLLAETAGLNDKGIEKRMPVSEGGGILNQGVYKDGSTNTTYVEANDYYGAWDVFINPAARYVFNASYIKLREITLSYQLSNRILEKTPFTMLSIGFIGRNLAIIKDHVEHLDPETGLGAGNIQGIEMAAIPTPRTYGFQLKLGL